MPVSTTLAMCETLARVLPAAVITGSSRREVGVASNHDVTVSMTTRDVAPWGLQLLRRLSTSLQSETASWCWAARSTTVNAIGRTVTLYISFEIKAKGHGRMLRSNVRGSAVETDKLMV